MTDANLVPKSIAAGDTWRFVASLSSYPAPSHSLTIVFWNGEQRFSIDSTPSGSDHIVAQTGAQSSTRIPGRYSWKAFAKQGSNRWQVAEGTTVVTPNVEGDRPFDTRSHARKVLDSIEAVIENRATKDQEEYQIDGRSLKRTPIADLLRLRSAYEVEAKREDRAARAAAGLKTGRIIGVRFG